MFEPLETLIRDRREELGLSQGEVAKRAGVGRAQYALLEAGKANVTLGFLLKITRVLGINAVQVRELGVYAGSPDLTALVRAHDAIRRTRALLARFSSAAEELDEIEASIGGLIAQPLAADAAVAGAVRPLTDVPAKERSGVSRAMRDVAQSERVERQKRPEAPASASAPAVERKRGRR